MSAELNLLKIKAGLLSSNRHLIEEPEVIDMLGTEFPVINGVLEKSANPSDIYKAMQCFADLTKHLVKKGNFKEVKHCFRVAEKMIDHGNMTVKNAIENCYLFSISTVLDMASPVGEKVKSLLTASLKEEYNRQIGACGI